MKYASLFIFLIIATCVLISQFSKPSKKSETTLDQSVKKESQQISWIETPWKKRFPQPSKRTSPATQNDPRFNYLNNGFNEYKDGLKISAQIALTKNENERIELIETLFSQFSWAFQSVPVGSENAEITQKLLGDNKKYLIFIPHDAQYINSKGEMLDHYGSPYFFHPESSKKMGIRSAGVDRKLWTEDDVVNNL